MPIKTGNTAPGFKLPGTDGKTYDLESYKGKAKAIVVAFWCNHCPYVIKSEDKMINLGNKFADKDVEFFLICSNDPINYPQDNFKNMKKRAEEKDYPFPYLHDESQEIAHAYEGKVTPHVFLLDGDLNLVYRGAIDDNMENERRYADNYLEKAIEALLDGKPETIEQKETIPTGCSIKWK